MTFHGALFLWPKKPSRVISNTLVALAPWDSTLSTEQQTCFSLGVVRLSNQMEIWPVCTTGFGSQMMQKTHSALASPAHMVTGGHRPACSGPVVSWLDGFGLNPLLVTPGEGNCGGCYTRRCLGDSLETSACTPGLSVCVCRQSSLTLSFIPSLTPLHGASAGFQALCMVLPLWG